MLEKADCPYQGSGPSGSFLALNKAAAKQIFRMAGLPTADWEFLPVRPAEGWEPRLPWPLFVKTTTGGSSLRLGRATNRQELDAIMDEIFAAGEGVLIEPQLPGKEITCGILGEEAMPPILIEPVAGDYFDYESKYATGGARELCPAPVSRPSPPRCSAWPWPPTRPWASRATAAPISSSAPTTACTCWRSTPCPA